MYLTVKHVNTFHFVCQIRCEYAASHIVNKSKMNTMEEKKSLVLYFILVMDHEYFSLRCIVSDKKKYMDKVLSPLRAFFPDLLELSFS